MHKIIKSFLPILFLFFLIVPVAFAQTTSSSDLVGTMEGPAQAMQSTAGFGEFSLNSIIAAIIKIILSFLAIIFLVLLIFSGYRWMTAAGNEEAVTKAKHTIKTSIIGLVIVLMAYSITYFIFTELPFTGTGGTGTGTINPPGGGSTP